MKYVAIDFETAYWGPGNACSLGIVTSDGKEIIDEWYHLIHPLTLDFDKDCMEIHGIHPEDVAEEKTFPQLWNEIAPRLKGNLVFAHNARFDMNVLASAIATYNLPNIHLRYADTVALSVKLWPDMENHKLNTVAENLGFSFSHHHALEDARACEYIVRSGLAERNLPSPEALLAETGQSIRKFLINRQEKKLIYQKLVDSNQ